MKHLKHLKHRQQQRRQPMHRPQRQSQPQQQRPSMITAARIRALNFILEQNRLLQRDNKALIGMVQRLRAELDEKNGGASKSGAKATKGTKGVKASR